jgi:uroporphyrinogen decarboxylase
MYTDPESWHRLAALLADIAGDYLRAQVEAGAQALQIFDSWIGALDAGDYREFVLPHVRALFARLEGTDVPVIHFGTGTFHLLEAQREAGGNVIGLDWRTPLDEGWARLGPRVGVQGNLDPTLLFGPRDRLLARVDDVLRRAARRPGHIFNLGHGILPGTPVENVKAVVDHVHAVTAAPVSAP